MLIGSPLFFLLLVSMSPSSVTGRPLAFLLLTPLGLVMMVYGAVKALREHRRRRPWGFEDDPHAGV